MRLTLSYANPDPPLQIELYSHNFGQDARERERVNERETSRE